MKEQFDIVFLVPFGPQETDQKHGFFMFQMFLPATHISQESSAQLSHILIFPDLLLTINYMVIYYEDIERNLVSRLAKLVE